MKKIYEILYPELEDDRVCRDIEDSACHEAPKNYTWNLISGIHSKLAEQLASPGVTLPWLLSTLGAPYFLIGLLQPIKEAGSMLPQLFIAAKIRSFAKRKIIWAAASFTQGLILAIIALALIWAPVHWQITSILIGLIFYSMASGVASVAFSDVLGKTIPQGARGHLLGKRGSLGGAVTLAAALGLHLFFDNDSSVYSFSLILIIAALLWIFSSLSFAQIDELEGETQGGANAYDELKKGIQNLFEDQGFRTFLLSRSLLLNITLSIPFYVLHSRELTQGNLGQVGGILFSLGLAQVLSSVVWGKIADKSSRLAMLLSATGGALAAIMAICLSYTGLSPIVLSYLYFIIFFILGLAQAGARIGRKTYLVDYASSELRPRYVALANTWMGCLSLLGISLGLLVNLFGLTYFFFLCVFINMTAILTAVKMKETNP